MFEQALDQAVSRGLIDLTVGEAWRARYASDRTRRSTRSAGEPGYRSLRSLRSDAAEQIATVLNDRDDLIAPASLWTAALAFTDEIQRFQSRVLPSTLGRTSAERRTSSRRRREAVDQAEARLFRSIGELLRRDPGAVRHMPPALTALAAVRSGPGLAASIELGKLYESLNDAGSPLAWLAAWLAAVRDQPRSTRRLVMIGNTATSLVTHGHWVAAKHLLELREWHLDHRPLEAVDEARLLEQEVIVRLGGEQRRQDAHTLFKRARATADRLERGDGGLEWLTVLQGRQVQLCYLLVGHDPALRRHTLDLAAHALDTASGIGGLRSLQAARRFAAASFVAVDAELFDHALSLVARHPDLLRFPDQAYRVQALIERARMIDGPLREVASDWSIGSDEDAATHIRSTLVDRFRDVRWAF